MARRQEYTWREAQTDLETVCLPWAGDHASRPGEKDLGLLPVDLERCTFQDVDEVVTWATPLPHVPEAIIWGELSRTLAKGLGGNAIRGWGLTTRITEDLKSQPAFADDPSGPTIIEQIQDDMRHGRNIAEATPHQILPDLGVASGATLRAVHDLSYCGYHNFMPLSPTLKFESFRGKPIANISKPVTNQVWVFPQTPSADKRDIPRRLRARMGRKTSALIDPILDDEARGTIFYNALTGSAMLPSWGKKGLTGLDFPDFYDSAATALRRVERVLPFAVFQNPRTKIMSWDIGAFINRDSIEASTEIERDLIFMDRVMQDLRARMQRLARVPVGYSRSEKMADLLGPAKPAC